MDHNLDDSLTLEGAIESMDFDHAGVVINQGDITLEGNDGVIPIQFEEQQMLMDTGNEEIIVTDFMADQFTLQEYSVQDSDQGAAVNLNQMAVISQTEGVLDLQLDNESVTQSIGQGVSGQQKFMAVKAGLTKITKKNEPASIPKQVAIAPKPPKAPKQPQVLEKATFASGKQYSIAPKPVALFVNNKNFKKVSLASVQGNKKGNTVWAPLGKKVLMVPADTTQKIKFVPNSKNVSSTQMTKPVMAKVIVQGGQSGMDVVNQQSVVPTKIIPTISASAASGAHYVMQPKTVPVSFARNKVLLGSPTKEGLRFSRKQIIAIKSPSSKVVPATTQGATTKRVVITTNPTQNVILKSTGSSKVAHISKDSSSLVLQGQHTQLHQVNVPGKGIQFIRLVSNPNTQAVAKAPPPKPGSWGPMTSHGIAVPSKSFVLTDSKGNFIQMTAEKMVTGQPPPLVITGNPAVATSTAERKLVRIAPVTSKSGQAVTQTVRSTQSLLAPLATMNAKVTIDDTQDSNKTQLIDITEQLGEQEEIHSDGGDDDQSMQEEQDSKIALHQIISDAVAEEQKIDEESEVQEEDVYDQTEIQAEDNSSNMDKQDESKEEEHPLIVIPSNFRQSVYSDAKRNNNSYSDEDSNTSLTEEQKSFAAMVNVETEITSYEPSKTPEVPSENDLVTTDLGLRPRKACNCTKSQCLKLYCDCFANGEFCNSCNCNNCHNNLENEELRQRAIRACLERNPYAFRPKIGKSKTGGPDIIRRHNKGCNCKRSGCLKNYCECYEAKIACTSMCKCVGCRNVEETLERRRELRLREKVTDSTFRPPVISQVKQPCSFMTTEVIEAVCQCLIAAAAESEDADGDGDGDGDGSDDGDCRASSPVRHVIDEFAKCLQDIIGASHQALIQPEQEKAC